MGTLKEHVGHERPGLITTVDELQDVVDVLPVALPGGWPLGQGVHVGRVHPGKNGFLERRIGETLAGMQTELVVLLLQYVHQQGGPARGLHRKPVVAVQAVEHRENAHLGGVATTVVLLEAQGMFGKIPKLRHDRAVKHVVAQRLDSQPDDIEGTYGRLDT